MHLSKQMLLPCFLKWRHNIRYPHWSIFSKHNSDWTVRTSAVKRRRHVTCNMAAPLSSVSKTSAERLPFNTTSFQKKTRSKLISIPGTRPSVQNGQLLVSTGVTSLDYLLGQCQDATQANRFIQ